MRINEVIQDIGFTIKRYETVSGGDINETYCLHGKDAKYFLKVNAAASYPEMFDREQEGLQELSCSSTLKIPQVIKCGQVNTTQYLLLEWIEKASPKKGFWQGFGTAMAMLHRQHQPYFGWKKDNYIGSIAQQNLRQQSWEWFYAESRIMPLVERLYQAGRLAKQDVLLAEACCKRLTDYFPEESPALLHGDFWSGNYMVADDGRAAIFDPAVYYGHREMDIGMTRLFGGFSQQFYDAYDDVYPLEKNWQQRLPLSQLYPLLVHAILFGGHYVNSSRAILKKFGC